MIFLTLTPPYRLKDKTGLKKVYSDHNSILTESSWIQTKESITYRYIISPKGYKEFRKKIEDTQVSKLLAGPNYQLQYDEWTKAIENLAKRVTKRKKQKGRAVRKLIRIKRRLRQSLKVKQDKHKIEFLKRRMKLLDEHIENEDKVKKANKVHRTVERSRQEGGTNGPGSRYNDHFSIVYPVLCGGM